MPNKIGKVKSNLDEPTNLAEPTNIVDEDSAPDLQAVDMNPVVMTDDLEKVEENIVDLGTTEPIHDVILDPELEEEALEEFEVLEGEDLGGFYAADDDSSSTYIDDEE